MRGRFAPSPTGDLHLGNLRTALLSWLQVKAALPAGEWLVRMEDLDRVTSSAAHEAAQLRDMAALGLVPDGEVVRQSDRFDRYRDAIRDLQARDLVYECFCTRREIREAAAAPHAPEAGQVVEGAYPGTCRRLTATQRLEHLRAGRRPALRLRTAGEQFEVHDLFAGQYVGTADDVVLQRNDGVPAYNLAVVVDDAVQGVTHVLRGDDLLASTPRQLLVQRLLGLPHPAYAHVPLVLAPDGTRLAKRHGAVTLTDLTDRGVTAAQVLTRLGVSLDLCQPDEPVTVDLLARRFRLDAVPRTPWRLSADDL